MSSSTTIKASDSTQADRLHKKQSLRTRRCGSIVDFTVALPSAKVTVDDFLTHPNVTRAKVESIIPSGQLSVLAADETCWGLGIEAARTLLERNQTDLDSIAWVIYAGSADWGIPFWSPAAKIAADLGVKQAMCFEVSNFCNAGFLALNIAEDSVRGTKGRCGLVIISDRLSLDAPMSSGSLAGFCCEPSGCGGRS